MFGRRHCRMQVTAALCVALTLSFAALSSARVEDAGSRVDKGHDLASSERGEIGGVPYTRKIVFPDSGKSDDGGLKRVRRLQEPVGTNRYPLCIMTFDIGAFTSQAAEDRPLIIAQILNGADLIATQGSSSMAAAQSVLDYINRIAGTGSFGMVVSDALPELYVIYFRTSILAYNRKLQAGPIQLSSGIFQPRPPLVTEFTYRRLNNDIVEQSFVFTLVTIRTEPGLNVQTELTALDNVLNAVVNPPYCFSQNAIILGGFNTANSTSALDRGAAYEQLEYEGGTTSGPYPQKQDRIYVRGDFTRTLDVMGAPVSVVPLLSTDGYRALVQKFWFDSLSVPSPIPLDGNSRYPVQFQVLTEVMPTGALPTPVCSFPQPPPTGGSCSNCLGMTLTNGVFPEGATSSASALGITPTPVGRDGAEFLNFVDLDGAPFIFSDEEREEAWCGNPARSCTECRGVSSGVSIFNQCSDRIMCPNLALKLVELLGRLQNCSENSRTLIVHDAWYEPDATNTNLNSGMTLHGQGLEARISVSEAVQTLPIIEPRDYSSDNAMLSTLASLALCIGFDYVRMNNDDSTLSVALRECSNTQTSTRRCTGPSLENGAYIGSNAGPTYQQGEYITAVCNPGFRLEGTSIRRRCVGVDGANDWSGQTPVCIRVCSDYMQPADSCITTTINLARNLVEFRCGPSCDPSCQPTYQRCNPTTQEFETVNVSPCTQEEGTTCDLLLPPFNGVREVIAGVRGGVCSAVQFSCRSGSMLIGSPIVSCQATGQYDYPVPYCSGDANLTEFTVRGFEGLQASSVVNVRNPISLSSATYSGSLNGPFPILRSGGLYNASIDRVVFDEIVPLFLLGVNLNFRTEVNVDIFSYIDEMFFYGQIQFPFEIDVEGIFDGNNCELPLTGVDDISISGAVLQFDVILRFCNSCSILCNFQEIGVQVYLLPPINTTLEGSFTLSDSNITDIRAASQIEMSGISFNISVAVRSEAGKLAVQEIDLAALLVDPFNVEIRGSYSEDTGQGMLYGVSDILGEPLMVQLAVDFDSETLSNLQLFSSISSPFSMNVTGSYSLDESDSGQFMLVGFLTIPGFSFFRGLIDVDVTAASLSTLSFEAKLEQPFPVTVSGNYNPDISNELTLRGSVRPDNASSTTLADVIVRLDTSDPVSVREIRLNGNFPAPLDSISYSGVYNDECSCAVVTGSVVQDNFTLAATATLNFDSDLARPPITELQVQMLFNDPLDMVLSGNYRYTSDNMTTVSLTGQFNASDVVYNVGLQLALDELSSFRLAQLQYSANLGPPLSISLQGSYDEDSDSIIVSGSYKLESIVELNAVVVYSFGDIVSTDSVQFTGTVSTDPFSMNVTGSFPLDQSNSSQLTLMGSLNVPEFTSLRGVVAIDLSTGLISSFDFEGMLAQPLAVSVSGRYNTEIPDELLLTGRTDMFGSTNVNFNIRLDTSEPVSVRDFTLIGNFPAPLDFIDYSGVYNDQCSCAMVSGSITQDNFTLSATTTLNFGRVQQPITDLQVRMLFNDPLDLVLVGTYRYSNDNTTTVNLIGQFNISDIVFNAGVEVGLDDVSAFSLTQLQFGGVLPPPLSLSLQGSYDEDSDSLVFGGSFLFDNVQLNALVVYSFADILSTDSVQFTGRISTDPFSMNVTGSFPLDQSNSSQLMLTGFLSVPEFASLTGEAAIDLSTGLFTSFDFEGLLSEPVTVTVSGRYNTEVPDELLLRGRSTLNSSSSSSIINVNVRIDTNDPVTVREIGLDGTFPAPLDFISYYGTYNEQCSCGVLRGSVASDNFTFVAAANVSVDTTEPAITDVQVQVILIEPIDIVLSGVYTYSADINTAVDLVGQFNLGEIPLRADVRLVLDDEMTFSMTQLQFTGTFPPPLSLQLQGGYDVDANDLTISGSVEFDFISLNASVTFDLGEDLTNASASFGDVLVEGRLTYPFDLDVVGQYMIATNSFMLSGDVIVNEYLTLGADLSLNTSTNPPALNIINFSGDFTTPIAFGGNFRGNYNPEMRQVLLFSHLDILRALFVNTTIGLSVDESNQLSLQSLTVQGVLDAPLLVEVAATIDPVNTTSFDLSGNTNIGDISFAVIAGVDMADELQIQEVTVSGSIQDPFPLDLFGRYDFIRNSLQLSSSIELPELHLILQAPVNLTVNPREIESFNFSGQLIQPLNLTVSGVYRAGQDLVLYGVTDIDTIRLTANVTLDTGDSVSVRVIDLDARILDPFDLDLRGSYSSSTGEAILTGNVNMSETTFLVGLTVTSDTISALRFSTNLTTPIAMMVSGSYSLDVPTSNSSQLMLMGSWNVPGFTYIRGMVDVNIGTGEFSSISFEALYEEPIMALLTGRLDEENSEELTLAGRFSLSNGTANLMARIDTTDLSVQEVSLSGNFPAPFDFISYSGTYNEECSCATVSGSFDDSNVTLVASTTITFDANQAIPTINELQFQVSLRQPLQDTLFTGVYRYSEADDTTVLNLIGQYNISDIMLTTESQLILGGSSNFSLSRIRFSGILPPPLGVEVQGEYILGSDDFQLAGTLVYDFAQFNLTLSYNFSDVLSAVMFDGSFSDPFAYDVLGQYEISTDRLLFSGMLDVEDFSMLRANISLDITTSPPTLGAITFAGYVRSDLPFESEFEGMYNPETNEAVMRSRVEATILNTTSFMNATTRLTVQNSTVFSIRSIVFENSLGTPFNQVTRGTYSLDSDSNEGTLVLETTMDLIDMVITIVAPVDLTEIPQVTGLQIYGDLPDPLNGSVAGSYMVGDTAVILSGVIDIDSNILTANVSINTTASQAFISSMIFTASFEPLSLLLTGTFDRRTQVMNLFGLIDVQTYNITAVANIDMSQDVPTFSDLILSVPVNPPDITLSGVYNPITMSALLEEDFTFGAIQLRASALLTLGAVRQLNQIEFSLMTFLPFDLDDLEFTGLYLNDRGWFVLESNFAPNALADESRTLIILSDRATPTQRLFSTTSPRVDVQSLVDRHIGIFWPTQSYPLVFSNISIYEAQADLTFNSINYTAGFRAQGVVKIFIFPEILIDANLDRVQSQFRVSTQIERALDWGIVAVCGNSDTFCNRTGPTLSVQVGSGVNQFQFSGGVRLFEHLLGTASLTVTGSRIFATIQPSQETQQRFFGLGSEPASIDVYWNDLGFYVDMQLRELMIQDFSFRNISSRSTCQNLGGVVEELAIDSPFYLDTSIAAREIDRDTIFVGVIFTGFVMVPVQGQTARLNVTISPKSLGIRIARGLPLPYNFFLKLIEQGLRSAGQQIIDDLLLNPETVMLFTDGRVGQVAMDGEARAVCRQILGDEQPQIPVVQPDPGNLIVPENFPQVVDPPTQVPVGENGIIAGTGGLPAQQVAFLSGISAGDTVTVSCLILQIFGGCSPELAAGGGQIVPTRDSEMIDSVRSTLGQTCNNESSCQQICQPNGDLVSCSCRSGFFLASDQQSCIRFDGCPADVNTCSSDASCTIGQDSTDITCMCFPGFTGDGFTCNDINECAFRNGGCFCDPSRSDASCSAQCTNSPGSFSCNCSRGYTLDSESLLCIDIDECLVDNGSCGCDPELAGCEATCTNTLGSFDCSCNAGYTLDERTCRDTNECLAGNGGCVCDESTGSDCSAGCTNTEGSFDCSCSDGHVLDDDERTCLGVDIGGTGSALSPGATAGIVIVVILVVLAILVLAVVGGVVAMKKNKKSKYGDVIPQREIGVELGSYHEYEDRADVVTNKNAMEKEPLDDSITKEDII